MNPGKKKKNEPKDFGPPECQTREASGAQEEMPAK